MLYYEAIRTGIGPVVSRTFHSVVVLILIGVLQPAAGKDAKGNFTVKGVGVLDCNTYIKSVADGGQAVAQHAGYLTGYVSAYNEHTPETFDVLPWQTLETLMELVLRRCKHLPDANFGATVAEMIRFFEAQKLTAMSAQVPVGEILTYPAVLVAIKASLAAHGYSTEDVAASMLKFQGEQGLSIDSGISQRGLLRLLYGKEPVKEPATE